MTLLGIGGRRYGPFRLRLAAEKIDEYVAATGDEPDRWKAAAPPGFAATALFTAAPVFFEDPDVAPFTRVLVHGEQRFVWHRPLVSDSHVEVEGAVVSVRRRSGLYFVRFEVETTGIDGPVVSSQSQFLMGDEPGGGLDAEERGEPPPGHKGTDERPRPIELPPAGPLPELAKSASRTDLVRYAGATLDWNPIHWDHLAAVAAGFGGVVVHGLLMAAWAMQAATRTSDSDAPLAAGRFRFRRPLPVGDAARVTAEIAANADEPVRAMVVSSGEPHMTADITLRGR